MAGDAEIGARAPGSCAQLRSNKNRFKAGRSVNPRSNSRLRPIYTCVYICGVEEEIWCQTDMAVSLSSLLWVSGSSGVRGPSQDIRHTMGLCKMRLQIYIYLYTDMSVSTYIYVCICIYIYTCICIWVSLFIPLCVYRYVWIHSCTRVCIFTCIHISIHIHIYIHILYVFISFTLASDRAGLPTTPSNIRQSKNEVILGFPVRNRSMYGMRIQKRGRRENHMPCILVLRVYFWGNRREIPKHPFHLGEARQYQSHVAR